MVTSPKIYVSIASYRDPFLQRTIDSLYCTADNPQNITVACFIHAFPEELQDKVPFNRYGYSVFYETEMPGTIFSVTQCRNRCLKWLDDSYDYVLQVDAHTAFDNGWDTQLIQMINSVDYEKALLSGALSSFGVYPDGRETRDKVILARTFYLTNESTKTAFINASDMAPDSLIVKTLPGKDYAHGWYLAGHFIFSSADYFRDIPQPEWVLFWGEEVINSIRAYTAGWNVYIFEDIPLYHLDENVTFTGRPRLWQDFPEEWFPKREPTSDRIVDIMNNINVAEGDLFYERSLQDLYAHIGDDLGKMFLEWREERRGKRSK